MRKAPQLFEASAAAKEGTLKGLDGKPGRQSIVLVVAAQECAEFLAIDDIEDHRRPPIV